MSNFNRLLLLTVLELGSYDFGENVVLETSCQGLSRRFTVCECGSRLHVYRSFEKAVRHARRLRDRKGR